MKINFEYGKFVRPYLGERHSGDAFVYHEDSSYIYIALIDALGHGIEAYHMSVELKAAIEVNWTTDPSDTIKKVGAMLANSVGAAIGVLVIEKGVGKFSYAGLGNISCKLISEKNHDLRSSDGILGMRNRSTTTISGIIRSNDLFILHSDGVSNLSKVENWDKYKYLKCVTISRKIVRELGTDYDDSSCAVVKCVEI